MATGPALSIAHGRRITVKNEFRDLFSLLDVLYANHFEDDTANQTEENFYRGAPPNWLDFHNNEQAASSGSETLFIKRDGYEKLKKQIQEQRKLPGISTVKLFHQSGSGGTTMAMQVLWDLKKTFRCAVLTDSSSDTTRVAQEVVQLFTAGSQGNQNTVLLLLNEEQILDKLQESIMMTFRERNIVTRMPVAILLSCVRKDVMPQKENVFLKRELSENEQKKFNEKKNELNRKYGEKIQELHGFNIMQTSFTDDYISKACEVFRSCSKARRPLKAQLADFLSLLNAYVPGSYLLESQCLDFLRFENPTCENIREEKMQPFGHLIVTYQQDERSERKVRMAHPLIAKRCTDILADNGVTRSDTARNLLNNFHRYQDHEEFPKYLLGFIKDMLTKREMKTKYNPSTGSEVKGDQERFSKLILDIQEKENSDQSASVLEVATNTFLHNPFFPQALARFCYIELKLYEDAEKWAKMAKRRDPQNSFITDTLGQVHKNHLLKKGKTYDLIQILQIAKKAIEAFKDEEQLAEEDMKKTDMFDDGVARIPHMFNCRGQFGFLQVCNLLYNLLVEKNENWKAVLTKNVNLCSVLKILGDNRLHRFSDLVNGLKGEVEKKAQFFDEYLTYSKISKEKDDPEYISEDTSECQKKYVGDLPSTQVKPNVAKCMHELQQNCAATSAGVLARMDREYSADLYMDITRCWKEIFENTNSNSDLTNFILAYVLSLNVGATFPFSPAALIQRLKQRTPLNHKDPPEQHLLALLLHWPTDSEEKGVFDLSQRIQEMHCSYETAYIKYFRSRYLHPLFFIGKGQDLDRIVHRKVLEQLDQSHQMDPDCSNKWRNENIFENEKVKERLLKVEGVVRNYRVFLTIGSKQIEIEANLQRSLWKARQVYFFLGFTIRGPVAFGIQTK